MSKLATMLVLAVCTACGPVEYIDHVTMRAADELEAAKSAGGDKAAPYEYTEAVEYLHKAREEEGYSDHQAAVRYGEKSEEMAKKAHEKALAGGPSDDGKAPKAPDAKGPNVPEDTP